ncbi:LAME_0B04742g1_1 [Lachancea meyersii CBS 8951]|uniref:rRNA methyltransferase 2, mitochondrial n=1 Tax=Lachancea meyersii CBS 8951 TaxID=1266667 RepID=A0A1G4IV20_9SACH|nr:LAME_0B04742g1_1 [Lachancea meyersii CBS 8951]
MNYSTSLFSTTSKLWLSKCIQSVRWNSSAKSRWLDRQRVDSFTREAKILGLRSRAAFKLQQIDDKVQLFRKNANQKVLDLGYAPGAWSQVAFDRTGPNGVILGVDILPCLPPRGVNSIQANILAKKTHELIRLFFSRHFQLYQEDQLHKDHGYFQHMLEEELLLLKENNALNNSKTSVDSTPIDVIISDMYEPWPQTDGFWNNFTNSAYDRMANTSGIAVKDHSMSMDLCDAALVAAIDLLKPGGSFVCKLYTGEEDKLLENRLKRVFKDVQRFKPSACRNESKEIYFIGLKKKKGVNKFEVFLS